MVTCKRCHYQAKKTRSRRMWTTSHAEIAWLVAFVLILVPPFALTSRNTNTPTRQGKRPWIDLNPCSQLSNTFYAKTKTGEHVCVCPPTQRCKGCNNTLIKMYKPNHKPDGHGLLGREVWLPSFLQSDLHTFSEAFECSPMTIAHEQADVDTQKMDLGGTPTEETVVEHLGLLLDRRKEPLCRPNASTQAWIQKNRYRGKFTFVFIISTGHSGTSYLGEQETWATLYGSDITESMRWWREWEGLNGPSDKRKAGGGTNHRVKALPTTADYCDKALEYVHTEKIPGLVKALNKGNKKTMAIGLQAGHETFLAMIPALILLLG